MSYDRDAYLAFKAMTPSEVEALIEAERSTYDPTCEWSSPEDTVGGGDVWFEWYDYQTEEIQGLGKVTIVDSFGGGEGGGETIYKVVRVEHESTGVRYFQKPGWYMSYDGSHYDGDLFEVHPQQVSVTVWQKVEEK